MKIKVDMIVISVWLNILCAIHAAEIVQRFPVHRLPDMPGSVSPWNMKMQEMEGPQAAGGKALWYNSDWLAKPWAGVSFKRSGGTLTITDEWLRTGCIRFLLNTGMNQNGHPNGSDSYQVTVDAKDIKYQKVNISFIDEGRGRDEDPASWQEVLVPLSYFTSIKPGMQVSGVSIQCIDKPTLAFGIADIAYVRFDVLPEHLKPMDYTKVAQPEITWPEFDTLPNALRADTAPPSVKNGAFCGPDGSRVFFFNPYCNEDDRGDLWGASTYQERKPNYGLYIPETQGFIYEEQLTMQSLCRLGFNSLSITAVPQPWWDAAGYEKRDFRDAALLPSRIRSAGLPVYLDLVCFPYTLGAPGENGGSKLPEEARTKGQNHWVPYRIIGDGKQAWLDLWRLYAGRIRDAGASVLAVELFNEPAYVDTGSAHRLEFVQWLTARYGTIEKVSEVWNHRISSWEEAATFSDDRYKRYICDGQQYDYDDYLSMRFSELVAAGAQLVAAELPGALAGVQTMGGYTMRPHEAIWKHRIIQHESIVLTATGGGSFTGGSGMSKPPASARDWRLAAAPYELELVTAMAGTKMVYDNETYLPSSKRRDARNRMWLNVITGLDGCSVFSWSKRGWVWGQGIGAVNTDAEKYPYSLLIPLAKRIEALRGLTDFAAEIHPIAGQVLPKPWGPKPRIAFIHCWDYQRWRVVNPQGWDKSQDYYAALRYAHWNMSMVGSDRIPEGLQGHDIAVLGAVSRAEPGLLTALEQFVRSGGILILGETVPDKDIYGHDLDAGVLTGHTGSADRHPAAELIFNNKNTFTKGFIHGPVTLTRGVPGITVGAGTAVIAAAGDRPVVTRHTIGKGAVYYSAADVFDYQLSAVLSGIIEHAASANGLDMNTLRSLEVRSADDGTLVPNILTSRRSHPRHEAVMLMNRDPYDKKFRVSLPGVEGDSTWALRDAITGKAVGASGGLWSGHDLAEKGFLCSVAAGDVCVFIAQRIEK